MRYSKKRETYASFLFACLLALFSCVGNVSRIVDPKQQPDLPTCHYSVALTLDRPTLAPSESTQANTVVTSLDGTPVSGQVSWSAQNPVVATVSPLGVVTAATVGTAVIEATISECTGAVPVTVEAPVPEAPVPDVAAVTVAVDSTSLVVSNRAQAVATAKDSAGNVIPDQAITWASSSPSVASVSGTGAITAIAAGIAGIEATVAGHTGSASVTVIAPPPPPADPPLPVAAVEVTIDSISLSIGHVAQATATAKDATGKVISGQQVTWASLAPNVATVSASGAVTAVAAGTATIQSTVSGISGTAPITVVAPAPVVASVSVMIDSASLAVSHVTQATATPKDAAGNVITGRAVTWESLAVGVATVSPAGAVQAVAAGSAVIQATVSGISGVATLTVVAPAGGGGVGSGNLAAHDFNNGTMGPYIDVWGGDNIDFPDDPTASGRGKVARMRYRPGAGNPGVQTSTDVDVAYDRRQNHVRYGYTIWMKGDLYLPYPGSALKADYNRKVIDYTGAGYAGIHTRMVLHLRSSKLYAAIYDYRNGLTVERFDDDTGITLGNDTWHTIEVRMTTNSADGVLDGILEVYMNGEATPSYSRTTGLGWITEAYPGGSFFSVFYAGAQLTIDADQPLFEEYRYWDNVAFSTTRIGQ